MYMTRSFCDSVPVDPVRHEAGRIMAGEKGHRVVRLAVGHGNARIGQTADARRDARHDAERHLVLDQRQRLFPAPAEHERIAAFQSQDAAPGARQLDEPERNVPLLRRRLAAALAGKDHLGTRPRPLQARFIDQRIMHDHIGLHQRMDREHRHQAGIAGAGADQPDMAGQKLGQAGKGR
jgi:hypothetical protein